MDLRQIAPGARTTVGRWSATALLALTGLAAGTGLVAPICYWQGLQRWEGELRHRPLAYSPEWAPANWLVLLLFVIWAGLWLLHARRVLGSRLGLLHGGLRMVSFVWSAWQASLFAYACNPF